MSGATEDRPIDDIITSVMVITENVKMPAQLKRDLEKLCIYAKNSNYKG